MNIQFEKATTDHINTIMNWLAEPHMMEFWDNTQEHKDDILNFIHGRKQTYFCGTFQYWIGSIDGTPYSFILSDILEADQKDLPDLYRKFLSKTGRTIALDFGIGNKDYIGKGLAAPTLKAFVDFYHNRVDALADTFIIDPNANNPRAQHVYNKAGFELVGDFMSQGGAFDKCTSFLMVKKLKNH